VKIILGGKGEWVTMPINRSYSGMKNINEIEIDNSRSWNQKMLKSISVNYGKARFFDEMYPIAETLLHSPGENLAEFNLNVINEFCRLLKIDTSHFKRGSAMNVSGNSTDLLVSIVNETGCNAYMCGGGASKYQEDEKFKQNNIELIYQDFKHPVYEQFNTAEFVPGLSVLDALMNCGSERTYELIKGVV